MYFKLNKNACVINPSLEIAIAWKDKIALTYRIAATVWHTIDVK